MKMKWHLELGDVGMVVDLTEFLPPCLPNCRSLIQVAHLKAILLQPLAESSLQGCPVLELQDPPIRHPLCVAFLALRSFWCSGDVGHLRFRSLMMPKPLLLGAFLSHSLSQFLPFPMSSHRPVPCQHAHHPVQRLLSTSLTTSLEHLQNRRSSILPLDSDHGCEVVFDDSVLCVVDGASAADRGQYEWEGQRSHQRCRCRFLSWTELWETR